MFCNRYFKIEPMWEEKTISLSSKLRLMCTLVISIFLYASETWCLTAEEKRNTSYRNRKKNNYRCLLGISYRDHIIKNEVGNSIKHAITRYEDLLTTVRKRKLSTRAHYKIDWTRKGDPTRHGAMSEKGKVRQKKTMGRQHIGMDRFQVGRRPSKG